MEPRQTWISYRPPLSLCMIHSSEQKTRGPPPRVLHEARPRGEPVRDHAAVLTPCEQGAAGSLSGEPMNPLV